MADMPSQCSPFGHRDYSTTYWHLLYLLNVFREGDAVLRATARKLTAHNPEQRSSILQVAASLSDVENVSVKRKVSQSLPDIVEVDGENGKPSTVKRQKI
jgi:hypothetical protein